jgi:hypothetical protein
LVDPELVGTLLSAAVDAVVPCAWLNASAKLVDPLDVGAVVPSVPPEALPPSAPSMPWICWMRAWIVAIPSIEI